MHPKLTKKEVMEDFSIQAAEALKKFMIGEEEARALLERGIEPRDVLARLFFIEAERRADPISIMESAIAHAAGRIFYPPERRADFTLSVVQD